MVFVADVIPPELRRIVEFLNGQMDPAEVLALEVKQYVGSGLRSLVPRVLGRTEQAQQKKAPAGEGRKWDEAAFFEQLGSRFPPEDVTVARRLLEWSLERGARIWHGNGIKHGSLVPSFMHREVPHYVFTLWTYGSVEMQLQSLRTRPPFDRPELREELRRRLNEIPGVSIPEERMTKRPPIPYALLRDAAAMARFVDAADWTVRTIRGA
jgi:hypothetical protein